MTVRASLAKLGSEVELLRVEVERNRLAYQKGMAACEAGIAESRVVIRRNEAAFREGSLLVARAGEAVVGAIEDLRAASRAHTEAVFLLIDKLNGNAAAG